MPCMKIPRFFPLLAMLPLLASCRSTGLTDSISEKIETVTASRDQVPERLQLAGESYVHSFYDTDLYFTCYEADESDIVVRQDGRIYYRPPHPDLRLLAFAGPSGSGTQEHPVYCAESQLDAAKAWFTDRLNWTCYYGHGTDMANRPTSAVAWASVDQFDALIKFCRENSYRPFGGTRNRTVQTVEFPLPEGPVTEIVFYKESNDGFFCSNKNDVMILRDGKLYLVYTYDFDRQHDGRNARILAVPLPEDLQPHFLSIIRRYGL